MLQIVPFDSLCCERCVSVYSSCSVPQQFIGCLGSLTLRFCQTLTRHVNDLNLGQNTREGLELTAQQVRFHQRRNEQGKHKGSHCTAVVLGNLHDTFKCLCISITHLYLFISVSKGLV